MQIEEIVPIIIFLVFISGSFTIFFSIYDLGGTYLNNVMCQQSASIRAMINGFFSGFWKLMIGGSKFDVFSLIPLICQTNTITIDDDSSLDPNKVISNEIASCWEKFGSGETDPIFPDASFLCSEIVFESTDVNKYVDLMKVYSLLYFNKSIIPTYQDAELPSIYYEVGINPNEIVEDVADLLKENAYYFEVSPFRFCNYIDYQLHLNSKLVKDGIYYGTEDNIKKNFASEGIDSLSLYSKNMITNLEFENIELTDNPTYNPDCNSNYESCSPLSSFPQVISGINFNSVPSSACLSLKEGVLNTWRLYNDYINEWKDSCIVKCKEDSKLIDEYNNCKTECLDLVNELLLKIIPSSDTFNSTRLYQGRFYIRFFDFTHWLLEGDKNLFVSDESQTMLFPISKLAFDTNTQMFSLSRDNHIDMVVLSYEPKVNEETQDEYGYCSGDGTFNCGLCPLTDTGCNATSLCDKISTKHRVGPPVLSCAPISNLKCSSITNSNECQLNACAGCVWNAFESDRSGIGVRSG